MKVLIIGGNRFFGKRLAQLLAQQGDQVTLLNRGRMDDGLGSLVHRIILDRKQLGEAPVEFKNKSWDLVFDQVGFTAGDARAAVDFFDGRVGQYVFTSSQSVYGPGANIPESAFDPFTHSYENEADPAVDYAEAKRQTEAVFFQNANFPLAAVRFPLVLGSDDYTGRLKFHVDHVHEQKPIFFPALEALISFVSSADAAKSLEFIGKNKITGPVNCCAPEPMRLAEFIKTIEDATGKRAILEKDGEHSPYGISEDWYMSVEKLRKSGLSLDPVANWLRQMI